MLKKYSVVGFYGETRQSFLFHVEAPDHLSAAAVVAANHEDTNLVHVIPGHLVDGEDIFYLGEGVVEGESILEDTETFPLEGHICD